MRIAYGLAALAALVGAVLAALAYLGPGTGVDGTPGALLALLGAVAVTLGALLALWRGLRGGWRGLLNAALLTGAALTAIAAWFLMQPVFGGAMAAAFAAVLAALLARSRRRPAR